MLKRGNIGTVNSDIGKNMKGMVVTIPFMI